MEGLSAASSDVATKVAVDTVTSPNVFMQHWQSQRVPVASFGAMLHGILCSSNEDFAYNYAHVCVCVCVQVGFGWKITEFAIAFAGNYDWQGDFSKPGFKTVDVAVPLCTFARLRYN